MTEKDQFQTFNVKVIVQETGLKPETLRAWERRYGLPRPERSAGRHRLYSRRDIEIIRWLISRQEDGLSISNAVDLWNTLESQGNDPLSMPEFSPTRRQDSPSEVGTIRNLKDAWVKACLAFDEQQAEQVLAQAFAIHPLETVCIELLGKGLASLGDGWYQGNTSVQQEHFASELAMRRLEALISAAPLPNRPGRILVAAPPEEHHDFILLIIALLMRRRGRDVIYLGSNVPLEHLEDVIHRTRPRLVISAVQQLHTAANLLDVSKLLETLSVSLAYGGRIFNQLPALSSRLSGYYLGNNLEQSPQVIERVMTTSNHLPPVEEVSLDCYEALNQFSAHLPDIEALVWQNFGGTIAHHHLAIANMSIARDIKAALKLGDLNFLGNEIHWIEGLMVNHGIPRQVLLDYFKVYHQMVSQVLDHRGAPIINWLGQITLVPSKE